MPKMERIFIRIDPETGALLRKWFASKDTTLAAAIQDFLMDEYEKALDAEPASDSDEDADLEAEAELDVEVEACPLRPAETPSIEA